MTLQIPLYLMAGAIYFSHFKRVTPVAALVAFLVLAATPAWIFQNSWQWSAFSPDDPHFFMSDEHREMVESLSQRAGTDDVLIVNKSASAWPTDDLWLAPEYPGKLYCGHFFLTVDYTRKCARMNQFYQDPPDQQVAFLEEAGIRFIYVDAADDPQQFARIPQLSLVKAAPFGSLFEYIPGKEDTQHSGR